jgi:ribosomal protein L29
MRMQKALGQLDVPLKLRTTRRELARVKTVLHQKGA